MQQLAKQDHQKARDLYIVKVVIVQLH